MRSLFVFFVLVSLTACKAETPTQSAPYSLAPLAETVIGDLGGVPVSIPREYVRLVEYEGDPHWLEKRKDPQPKRTFESKVVSFGILIHQPTMKPLTKENLSAYTKRNFWDNEWMDASVLAGVGLNFDSLEMFTNPYFHWQPGRELYHKSYEYESLPDVHGLKAWRATKELIGDKEYVLDELDHKNNMKPHRLYFASEDGNITVYIKCGSGAGGRSNCSQHFVLWPEMKAQVIIRFEPTMLPNWRLYRQQFRDLILSFRTEPNAKSVFTFPPSATVKP